MRGLAGAPAEIAVELEKMHRRIVHADADPVPAHGGDELRARRALGQHDLEHVPVRLAEIRGRQLAAERRVPALEVAARELAAPLRKALKVRQLAEADARGDIRQVELAAGDLD